MRVQLITERHIRPKRFTPREKPQVLKKWELCGNGVEIAKEYEIHPHTLYRWRKAMEQGGETCLPQAGFSEWEASQK